MRKLRFGLGWLAVGWVMVLAVVIGSTLLGGPSIPTVSYGDKGIHFIAYFVLMLWFSGVYQPRYYIWVALGLLALGMVLEIVQGAFFQREFSWLDQLANTVGVGVGWVVAILLVGGWCLWIESLILPKQR